MAITTRQTSGSGVTAKNAPLTHGELDQNFIDLVQGKLVSLSNTVNIPWTISVKSQSQLSTFANTVTYGQSVFSPDILEIPTGTTYTIEETGQLNIFASERNLIEYNKKLSSWETIDFNSIVDTFSPQTLYYKNIEKSTLKNITEITANNVALTNVTANNVTANNVTLSNIFLNNVTANNVALSNVSSAIFLVGISHTNIVENYSTIPDNVNTISSLPIFIPSGTYVTIGSGSYWNFVTS